MATVLTQQARLAFSVRAAIFTTSASTLLLCRMLNLQRSYSISQSLVLISRSVWRPALFVSLMQPVAARQL